MTSNMMENRHFRCICNFVSSNYQIFCDHIEICIILLSSPRLYICPAEKLHFFIDSSDLKWHIKFCNFIETHIKDKIDSSSLYSEPNPFIHNLHNTESVKSRANRDFKNIKEESEPKSMTVSIYLSPLLKSNKEHSMLIQAQLNIKEGYHKWALKRLFSIKEKVFICEGVIYPKDVIEVGYITPEFDNYISENISWFSDGLISGGLKLKNGNINFFVKMKNSKLVCGIDNHLFLSIDNRESEDIVIDQEKINFENQKRNQLLTIMNEIYSYDDLSANESNSDEIISELIILIQNSCHSLMSYIRANHQKILILYEEYKSLTLEIKQYENNINDLHFKNEQLKDISINSLSQFNQLPLDRINQKSHMIRPLEEKDILCLLCGIYPSNTIHKPCGCLSLCNMCSTFNLKNDILICNCGTMIEGYLYLEAELINN